MSIATRTGDDGTTGLFGGARVAKDHLRIEAFGAVDELNAHLGAVRSECPGTDLDRTLERIQSELFDLGAELATPRAEGSVQSRVPPFPAAALEAVDRDLAAVEKRLPPIRAFILPGGHRIASALHVARTVCRRAERELVTLAHAHEVPTVALRYVNRLSDLLFQLAREENRIRGVPEPEWHPRQVGS